MTHGIAETSLNTPDIIAIGDAIELRFQADRLAEALDENNLAVACEATGNILGIPPTKEELFRREDDWNAGAPRHMVMEGYRYDLSPSSETFVKGEAEEFAFDRRPRFSEGKTPATYEESMRSLSQDPVNQRLSPAGAQYAHELANEFANDKRRYQMREGVKRVGLMEFVEPGRLVLHTPYSMFAEGHGTVSGVVASVAFDHNHHEEVQAYFEGKGFTLDHSEPPVVAKLRQASESGYFAGQESLEEHLGISDEQIGSDVAETPVLPTARVAIEDATLKSDAPVRPSHKLATKIMPAPEVVAPKTKYLELGSLVTAEEAAQLQAEKLKQPSALSQESIGVQIARLGGLGEHTAAPSHMEVVGTLREALTMNEGRLSRMYTPREMAAVRSYLDAHMRGQDVTLTETGLGRIAQNALKMAYDYVDGPDHQDASKRLAALDALKHLRKAK